MPVALEKICKQAMDLGLTMDLSDCSYGETTGPLAFLKRPTSYYFFLAGFVRLQRLNQILETGTNSGGSIMSMSKGLHEDDIPSSRLVTVDIVAKNDEGFKKYPDIKRVYGDSLDGGVVKEVINSFEKNIDLLYVDSLHEYEHTKKNIEIYGNSLSPRYIILDDIRQCDEMKRLWKELEDKLGDMAFDASEIAIRKGAGFGVIQCR